MKRQNAAKFGVGLFLLSPLPSAQLFEAAGLLEIQILRLSAAFFVGRIISLSIYLAFSHLIVTNISRLWEKGFNSWWAIAFEVVAILLLIAMFNMRQIVQTINRRRTVAK